MSVGKLLPSPRLWFYIARIALELHCATVRDLRPCMTPVLAINPAFQQYAEWQGLWSKSGPFRKRILTSGTSASARPILGNCSSHPLGFAKRDSDVMNNATF